MAGAVGRVGGESASYEVGRADGAGFFDDEAVDEGLGGGFAPGVGAGGDDLFELGAQGVEFGLCGRFHGRELCSFLQRVAVGFEGAGTLAEVAYARAEHLVADGADGARIAPILPSRARFRTRSSSPTHSTRSPANA